MEFKKIQAFFFFNALLLTTLLFFWTTKSLFYVIFWTVFFAIVFYPIYKIFLKKTKNKKNLSSFLTLVIIVLVIIIPISISLYLIAQEIPDVNSSLLSQNKIDEVLSNLPFTNEANQLFSKYGINPDSIKTNLINSFKESLNEFGGNIVSIGKNTAFLIVQFFIMLYFLFFALKDGKLYLTRLSKILPLGNKTEKRLFLKFASIVRSIFKGTLIVSAIQGMLGGILFFFVGIDGFFVWTILMMMAAMIPAIGVGIILVPAAIIMFLTSQIGSGIAILIGLLLISTVDNILRPYIIGHETEMPDILITASILGGLTTFGMTGLIIGPVIAGLFLAMWHIFEEKYNKELDLD